MTDITAAILVIGNEILSGKTQDANIAFLGKRLAKQGIHLVEVRIVRDIEDEIVKAVNDLRHQYTYVFTTGGIGPTHDDITVDSISKAFGLPVEINAEAKDRMETYYKSIGSELNEARLRMARAPVGAELISNTISVAPGVKIGNVYIMAGIPKVMQAMFEGLELEGGAPVVSRTLHCLLKEGDYAARLNDIQKAHNTIDIGSYPHYSKTGPSASLVVSGTDATEVDTAFEKVMKMAQDLNGQPEEE